MKVSWMHGEWREGYGGMGDVRGALGGRLRGYGRLLGHDKEQSIGGSQCYILMVVFLCVAICREHFAMLGILDDAERKATGIRG